MNKRPGFAELSAFSAIAEFKSFRRAAEELGLSASTLSHMIRALEKRLGVRLFNRTTRSVSTTEAGERLFVRLQPVLSDLQGALDETDAYRSLPRGTLRINASTQAVRLLIHSVIPEYQRRYPEVHVDLVTQGEFVDIVADGFDAGVRLREAVPRDMVAVELGGAQHFVPVAAPAYMAGRNMPAVPEDLAAHDCIRFRMPSGRLYRWEFEKDGEARSLEAQGSMTLDDISLMVESAIGGLGVAFVPAAAVKVDIEEGRLISLLPEWCPPFPGWCLYYAGHRHVPPALRALIEVVRNLNESRASQR